MGYSTLEAATVNSNAKVTISGNDDAVVMENEFVKVEFNKNGGLVSFYDKKAERESIETGNHGNQFVMYEDIPMYWDAW